MCDSSSSPVFPLLNPWKTCFLSPAAHTSTTALLLLQPYSRPHLCLLPRLLRPLLLPLLPLLLFPEVHVDPMTVPAGFASSVLLGRGASPTSTGRSPPRRITSRSAVSACSISRLHPSAALHSGIRYSGYLDTGKRQGRLVAGRDDAIRILQSYANGEK